MTGGFFDFHEKVTQRRTAETPASPEPLTVSQLTGRIERAIRTGLPDAITVRGQVSNFRPNQSSGHLYFTLKDSSNCIDCVMWRSDAVRARFTPTDGIELLAGGRVVVYGQRGRYQLQVATLRPIGKGSLELAFQQLREKLAAAGLFDTARKRPLPRYPTTIALVTGADTAALQDQLKVLSRFPWVRVILCAVPVQGEGAATRIAAMLNRLSQDSDRAGAEVILLARGGGSLEDLWAFNEEPVVRAVAASRLPVVTGIGHEVDTTLADLAADYHAHTPTEAAQVIVAHWREARDDVATVARRLDRAVRSRLDQARRRLKNIERHETFRRPLDRINALRQLLDDRHARLHSLLNHRLSQRQWALRELRGRLDRRLPALLSRHGQRLGDLRAALRNGIWGRLHAALADVTRSSDRLAIAHPRHRLRLEAQSLSSQQTRLARAVSAQLAQRHDRLDALSRQLAALAPQNVLRRGYSMTIRKKDGALLRSATQVKPGDRLLTHLAEGQIESIAEDPKQPRLFD